MVTFVCDCCQRELGEALYDGLYTCCADCAFCQSLEHRPCCHGIHSLDNIEKLTEPMPTWEELVALVRSMPPMTEEEKNEQRASFAFGNMALTREWASKSDVELEQLRQLCRQLTGCAHTP